MRIHNSKFPDKVTVPYNLCMGNYRIRENIGDEILKSYGEHPELLAKLLHHRRIGPNEAKHFLSPSYETGAHDPLLLKGMDRAVGRVLGAIHDDERIVIWSDYDADGIPGAVILHDFFKKIGYENFENYIPDRHEEGFGLNAGGIEEIAGRGTKLLITVDCGIADAKEVEHARALGIDTIITDHHLPNGPFPNASAVVNPNQEGCTYPNKNLCGAGVAFKLVQALLTYLIRNTRYAIPTSPIPLGWEKWLLDMVGLATLSDMVPLIGENRTLAHYGLKVLRKSPRPGLRELLSRLKINQRHITEDDVGFMITPRINAASRMGKPMDAFRLLATSDLAEAAGHADHLNRINDERKGHVAAIVKAARKIMAEREHATKRQVIVFGNPSWRPSLLGLVANTLVEEHGRPVFLWGREGGERIKGSCRSDGSISVVSLMEAAGSVLLEFGGHRESGGFTVSEEGIHHLPDELERAYEKIRGSDLQSEKEPLWIDTSLSLDDINEQTYGLVEALSPFGTGNPKPLFLFESLRVAEVRQFGRDKSHLSLSFNRSDDSRVSAVSFFTKPDSFGKNISAGNTINLVAALEKSFFRATPELRLRIVDIL